MYSRERVLTILPLLQRSDVSGPSRLNKKTEQISTGKAETQMRYIYDISIVSKPMNLHERAINYGELTWGLFPFRYGNEYVNMILIHTQSTLTSVVTVTTQWT